MDRCERCGATAEYLRELHHFPEDSACGLTTEYVCRGCLTKVEEAISRPEADHDALMALSLSIVDGMDRVHWAHCDRMGTSPLGFRKVADDA